MKLETMGSAEIKSQRKRPKISEIGPTGINRGINRGNGDHPAQSVEPDGDRDGKRKRSVRQSSG